MAAPQFTPVPSPSGPSELLGQTTSLQLLQSFPDAGRPKEDLRCSRLTLYHRSSTGRCSCPALPSSCTLHLCLCGPIPAWGSLSCTKPCLLLLCYEGHKWGNLALYTTLDLSILTGRREGTLSAHAPSSLAAHACMLFPHKCRATATVNHRARCIICVSSEHKAGGLRPTGSTALPKTRWCQSSQDRSLTTRI